MHDAERPTTRIAGTWARRPDMRISDKKVFDSDLLYLLPCIVLEDEKQLRRLRCYSRFLEASTLLAMLAAVKPRTMATTLIRISRAMDTVEGDKSKECLIFNVEKAMTCLTATSERSIWHLVHT